MSKTEIGLALLVGMSIGKYACGEVGSDREKDLAKAKVMLHSAASTFEQVTRTSSTSTQSLPRPNILTATTTQVRPSDPVDMTPIGIFEDTLTLEAGMVFDPDQRVAYQVPVLRNKFAYIRRPRR